MWHLVVCPYLHNLILQLGQEEVDDLVLLDGQRVQVDLLHTLDLASLYETAELGDGLPFLLVALRTAAPATATATSTSTVTATAAVAEATAGCTTSVGHCGLKSAVLGGLVRVVVAVVVQRAKSQYWRPAAGFPAPRVRVRGLALMASGMNHAPPVPFRPHASHVSLCMRSIRPYSFTHRLAQKGRTARAYDYGLPIHSKTYICRRSSTFRASALIVPKA